MIGKLRFYLWAGFTGFILTFLFTVRNNLWLTSFNRALIAFAVWFVLAYLLKWVFNLASAPAKGSDGESERSGSIPEEQLGNRLDLTTPDEDKELMNLIKPEPEQDQEGNGFVPLDPPKLVSTKDPEELAKAVRHLTEK
ncbi:hypothetical protein SAMN05661091_2038 [Paenibacillus uliginis N3/975]|uniref:Uncharacterized protein n=1 Tax=Paenibacillus uliginis N3/975 TaxID=1313296 RepID=A0A1X7H8L6_9BACL|nr:hypothetical protein [Paenibacillus uliginis]SMF81733.1 hypothetical protein SAMN05661091_2038 [Paenibacillus uliginis N3/975]